MNKSLTLWLALCLLLAGAASSRTWNIYPDGSGDAATIDDGVHLASGGDTVLVHPGEYTENIYMSVSYVSLVSSGGNAVTVLKNERGEGWAIIYGPCRGGLIQGFTFQGVPGKSGPGITLVCDSGMLAAEIEDNVFVDLVAYQGGGVDLYDGASAAITRNEFRNCTGWDVGGGVSISYGSSARIEDNTFSGCYSKVGGAIGCSGNSTCEVIGNTLEDNEALENGGGVFLYECPSGLVEDNVLKANHANLAGGGVYVYDGSFEVRWNIFWSNRARYGGGLAQSLGAGLTCENNTFFENTASDCGSAARLGGDVASRFAGCIVSNSSGAAAVDCIRLPLPEVDCNAFYMNPGDYRGCSPGPHDVFACPSFCFADAGDFELCDESPCLPGNHPGGYDCGLIGALGQGCSCGPTAVRPTTLGAIKAMYR